MRAYQLPVDAILGKWLFERWGLWQIPLEDERGIDSFSGARGLTGFFIGKHIRLLWQLGLLYADLIESSDHLDMDGLMFLGQDTIGKNFYADERELRHRPEGWAGSASDLAPFPQDVRLYFHPFRYYVLYHIQTVLETRATPLQMLFPLEYYPELLQQDIQFFTSFSKKPEFTRNVYEWNRVAALSIATEPCFYERLFGSIRHPVGIELEEQMERISDHWTDVQRCFQEVGLDQMEKYRRDLCIAAEMLDPNKYVHTMLRLTRGERRFKHIKGRLGGAICLLTMAEMLRRASEKTFKIQLPEEDELGFGIIPLGVKKRLYGSERPLDADRAVKNQFLRTLGLGYGVRLRWYVEGTTEYHAIESILGSDSAIDLVNLRGQVAARGGRGLAFRDTLRSDIRSRIFSFISIDGDRADNLKVVRRAAEDDDMCGRFFVSRPDFEFENFTIAELENILWEVCIQNGADEKGRRTLHRAIGSARTSRELLSLARRALPQLAHLDKGEEWGKRLMAYAWENPEMSAKKSGEVKRRQIVEAVEGALRAVRADYLSTRSNMRVDSTTGMLVERNSKNNDC